MSERVVLVGPLDRVLYLRTLPALERLPAADLAAIASHAREEFHPRGAPVVRAQESPTAFHIVVEGRVAVRLRGVAQPDAVPGESVGLLALLARLSAGLEVTAVEDTLLLRIDADDHLELCARHFPIVEQYLRYLAHRAGEQGRAVHEPVGAWSAPETERALDVVERMVALWRTGVFPRSAPDAVGELARHVSESVCPAGRSLWNAGDPADDFVTILHGGATAMSREMGDAVRVQPGDTVGLADALGTGHRMHTVTADTDLRVLRIGIAPLLDIMEDHHDLALDFLALRASEVL